MTVELRRIAPEPKGTPIVDTVGTTMDGTRNRGKAPVEAYVLLARREVPPGGSPEAGSPTP